MMMTVGFDLLPGGASTMMMPSGTKFCMSGGQSGQRLSMRQPKCVGLRYLVVHEVLGLSDFRAVHHSVPQGVRVVFAEDATRVGDASVVPCGSGEAEAPGLEKVL
eukprot:2273135-Rhodomonas_salina.1